METETYPPIDRQTLIRDLEAVLGKISSAKKKPILVQKTDDDFMRALASVLVKRSRSTLEAADVVIENMTVRYRLYLPPV